MYLVIGMFLSIFFFFFLFFLLGNKTKDFFFFFFCSEEGWSRLCQRGRGVKERDRNWWGNTTQCQLQIESSPGGVNWTLARVSVDHWYTTTHTLCFSPHFIFLLIISLSTISFFSQAYPSPSLVPPSLLHLLWCSRPDVVLVKLNIRFP